MGNPYSKYVQDNANPYAKYTAPGTAETTKLERRPVMVDQEGRVEDVDMPPQRPLRERAEDVLTRMASSLSFGGAEKLSATDFGRWMARAGKTDIGDLIQGKLAPSGPTQDLTYDQLLAQRRAETEAAGQRLGTAGTLAADIAGGGLLGSAASRLPALWP